MLENPVDCVLESNPGDDDRSVLKPIQQRRRAGTNDRLAHFQGGFRQRAHRDGCLRRQVSAGDFRESRTVTEIPLQPNMAERAIDTATDVSRTMTDVSAALQAAVDRLSDAIRTARQPGKPLSTLSAITREAPLASLLVAFLFGVAVARRR